MGIYVLAERRESGCLLASSRTADNMTAEQQIVELREAVSRLNAEALASRKREEDAAAAYRDLQVRLEVLTKQGQLTPKPEGIGLGRRTGGLVSHFDGNLQQYPNFRADVMCALQLLNKDFRDEQEKVGFIMSHLHGDAKAWLRNLWRDKDPALQNADAFIKAMDGCFLSSIDVDLARQQIHGLKQGRASVRQYHARFFALVSALEWDRDSAPVRDLFWEGLHGSVKDEIARGERPRTTQEIVQRALAVGVRLEGRPWSRDEGRGGREPARGSSFLPREAARAQSTPPPGGGAEPMEVGGARAQSAARALAPAAVKAKPPRGNRKCYICDDPQHMAKECPQRLHKHTAASAMVTAATQQGQPQQGNEGVWLEEEALGPSQTCQ